MLKKKLTENDCINELIKNLQTNGLLQKRINDFKSQISLFDLKGGKL